MVFSWLRNWIPRRTKPAPKPSSRRGPRRSRLSLEALEDRTVPSTIRVAGGLLDYVAGASVNDKLTLSVAGSTYTFSDTADTISLGSGTAGFTGNGTHTVTGPAASFHGIELFFGQSNNTVTIQATGVNVSVNDSAGTAGEVIIDVGGGPNGAQGVLATVADLTTSYSVVRVNDTADTVGRRATITSGGESGLFPGHIELASSRLLDFFTTAGSGGNTFTIAGTPANVNSSVGTGTGNDTTSIEATGAGSFLSIEGSNGRDLVNLGSNGPNLGGTLANIHGQVAIANEFGQTDLSVDDSGDTTPSTNARVSDSFLTGLGTSGAVVEYTESGIGALNVFGGHGGNTFTVLSTGKSRVAGEFTTNIEPGFGNDTTYVEGAAADTNLVIDGQSGNNDKVVIGSNGPGSGSTLAGVAGMTIAVVNASGGHTALTIDDSGDTTAQTAVLQTAGTPSQPVPEFAIQNYAPANTFVQTTFDPAALSSLTVKGGSGGNTYNVSDFGAGLPTTIDTGTGNAAVNVTVDATSSYRLTLNGGSGSNSLSINDPSRAATFDPNPAPQNSGTVDANYLFPGVTSVFTYINMGSVSTKPDANHSFVQSLFHAVYGRSGSQAELDHWVNQLPTLGQAGVASAINHTTEAYRHVVDGWFRQFLGERPDAREQAKYVGALGNGATQEHVLAQILATPEFLQQVSRGQHESRDEAYVEALYSKLLGIPESQVTRAEVRQGLHDLHRLGRAGLAHQFLTSAGYRTLQVTADYERLLRRAPTAQERADWVNSGLDLLSIQIGIESTPAFFTHGF